MKKQTKESIKEEIKESFPYLDFGLDDTPPIVKVVWEDAQTSNGTISYEEIMKVKLVQAITIGYLMNETSEYITLCSFLFPDQNSNINSPDTSTGFNVAHIIPKAQIKNVIFLKIDWEESRKYKNKEIEK